MFEKCPPKTVQMFFLEVISFLVFSGKLGEIWASLGEIWAKIVLDVL